MGRKTQSHEGPCCVWGMMEGSYSSSLSDTRHLDFVLGRASSRFLVPNVFIRLLLVEAMNGPKNWPSLFFCSPRSRPWDKDLNR